MATLGIDASLIFLIMSDSKFLLVPEKVVRSYLQTYLEIQGKKKYFNS